MDFTGRGVVTGPSIDKRETSRDAARNLARLMERGLGYNEGHIDPIALRLFLAAYWDRVSTLAHAIHGCPGDPC
jgi:hypothetical protein